MYTIFFMGSGLFLHSLNFYFFEQCWDLNLGLCTFTGILPFSHASSPHGLGYFGGRISLFALK
jgi:hypothetical protein